MAHFLFTSTGIFMMDPVKEVDDILRMKRYLAEEEVAFMDEMLAAGYELDFVDIYEIRFKNMLQSTYKTQYLVFNKN